MVEELLAAYADCIDSDRLEEWPGFFTEKCLYKIIPWENVSQNLALGWILCESRGMLQDRVVAHRTANLYAPHRYRHIVGAVLGLFLFPPVTLIAYIVLALALPVKPPALYANREEETFWRGVSMAPDDTFHSLKRKFTDLEARLGHMETQVASGDFELHRKFRDLGR